MFDSYIKVKHAKHEIKRRGMGETSFVQEESWFSKHFRQNFWYITQNVIDHPNSDQTFQFGLVGSSATHLLVYHNR